MQQTADSRLRKRGAFFLLRYLRSCATAPVDLVGNDREPSVEYHLLTRQRYLEMLLTEAPENFYAHTVSDADRFRHVREVEAKLEVE